MNQSVVNALVRSLLFIDARKPTKRDNQDRWSERDEQVYYDHLIPLSLRHSHNRHGRETVQAAVYNESSRRRAHSGRKTEASHDVTPNGCPIISIIAPNIHVDEVDETLRAAPEDVKDAADIPI